MTKRRSNPAGVGMSGAVLWVVIALAASGGCDRERDQVRAYRTPKEPSLSGPAAQEPPSAPQTPKRMAWDLPEGWRQTPNPNQMRFATLLAGTGDEQLEVSITQLAGAAGGVGPNINRWRGQIGLPPASESELATMSVEIHAPGGDGVLVDIEGVASGAGDRPRMLAAIFATETHTWFIKATAASAVVEQHRDGFAALCESVRFVGGDSPHAQHAEHAKPQPPAAPKWDAAPAGWTLDSPPRPMAVASFTIAQDEQEAAVTITPLPGPTNLLANINRWRRQVGLDPLGGLDQGPPQEIDVAGEPGHLVDLAGETLHTIGVISTRGTKIWFYKMSGPDPLVAAQKKTFESFVRSIRFEGASGE